MAPAASASTGGLYDSSYEHDACGVGFVADLSGLPSHDTVAKALTVLRNLEHRGAQGSDPDTGDGAGILTQIPDAFFRAECGFDLPVPGGYAAGMVFLPAGGRPGTGGDGQDGSHPGPGHRRGGGDRGTARRRRGPDRAGLARRPGGPGALRPGRARRAARAAAAFRHRPGRERRRPGPAGFLPAQAGRARGRLLPGEPVQPDHRLQGHADRAAAGAVLPRPVRPPLRLRAGPGALAVLDQHLPVLAAGPPVPLHRAQRGDQHGPRQPELDAGPRGHAGVRPVPAVRGRPGHGAAAAHPG